MNVCLGLDFLQGMIVYDTVHRRTMGELTVHRWLTVSFIRIGLPNDFGFHLGSIRSRTSQRHHNNDERISSGK